MAIHKHCPHEVKWIHSICVSYHVHMISHMIFRSGQHSMIFFFEQLTRLRPVEPISTSVEMACVSIRAGAVTETRTVLQEKMRRIVVSLVVYEAQLLMFETRLSAALFLILCSISYIYWIAAVMTCHSLDAKNRPLCLISHRCWPVVLQCTWVSVLTFQKVYFIGIAMWYEQWLWELGRWNGLW